ncbi:RES domain-containing protein [Granulicella sp. dw_53]|uniref:RES family NAD+ phosphorylase n=1 Tax=Granulicella sp. dw_53 TaxID=2719792 RepID=UPI001BD4B26E|nr:RES domain-containing protein [Granulicella sp. dw_53]
MITVYRLLRHRFAGSAFDGQGSFLFGGRWSNPGTRIVYTAEHLSLAMLEYLAHLDPRDPPSDLVLAKATIPDTVSRIVYPLADLPSNWRSYPAPPSLAEVGTDFVSEGRAAILIVPSVLASPEVNLLLNPNHPDFSLISRPTIEPFSYNDRLI